MRQQGASGGGGGAPENAAPAASAADVSAGAACGGNDQLLPLPEHLNVNKIVRQVRRIRAPSLCLRVFPRILTPYRRNVARHPGGLSRIPPCTRPPSSPLAPLPQIKRADLGVYNCLRSIAADAEFVDAACAHHRPLPVFANLRCGLWYLRDPASAQTCYFKVRPDGPSLRVGGVGYEGLI